MQQALEAFDDRASLMKWQAAREALRRELEKPAAQWVGLTDEEIEDIHCTPPRLRPRGKFPFARMIEAKLKEKNT